MNLGLTLEQLVGNQPMPAPDLGAGFAPSAPAAPHHLLGSKGAMIAGIIGDALASASGGQPIYTQSLMQQRQRDAEDAQWTRRQNSQLQNEMALKQFELANKPVEYEYQHDNVGNLWKVNKATGETTLAHVDNTPKMTIQGDQAIQTPNPYAAGGMIPQGPSGVIPTVSDANSYAAVPPGAQYQTPDGHIRVKGGAGGNASGGFR